MGPNLLYQQSLHTAAYKLIAGNLDHSALFAFYFKFLDEIPLMPEIITIKFFLNGLHFAYIGHCSYNPVLMDFNILSTIQWSNEALRLGKFDYLIISNTIPVLGNALPHLAISSPDLSRSLPLFHLIKFALNFHGSALSDFYVVTPQRLDDLNQLIERSRQYCINLNLTTIIPNNINYQLYLDQIPFFENYERRYINELFITQ